MKKNTANLIANQINLPSTSKDTESEILKTNSCTSTVNEPPENKSKSNITNNSCEGTSTVNEPPKKKLKIILLRPKM